MKIFTWRANGDGIDPLGNTKIEDCFIRTQDDSSYISGRGIKRVVYWNDSNGSTFVLSHIGWDDFNSHPLVIEDCTVVYARAHWHHWSGGSLFNMRGSGRGSGGYNLIFRNIVQEDPRPTLQPYKLLMEGSSWFPGGAINLGRRKNLSGQIQNSGQLMWEDQIIYVGE